MAGRITAVAAGGLGLAVLAGVMFHVGPGFGGWAPGCLFQRWFGLHCAGCGMTRAAWHLLHGEPLEAFRKNPLLVVLAPVVAVGIGLEIAAWVRGSDRPTPRLRPAPWVGVGLVVVILGYAVLRNLPWWPFSLLAP